MNKCTALVPMKANSVRIKDKNIRQMGNVPLFYHILKTLQSCKTISEICVDTDSDIIKELIHKDFKAARIIDRPEHLAGPFVAMNDVIAYDLSLLEGNFFLQTHSTNPLLRPQSIDNAINFFTPQQKYDSLFSATKLLKRFYDKDLKPVNHDAGVLLNTQDLSPLYEENSCIYLFTRKSFLSQGNRIGRTPYLYEINRQEAIDIDDEFDFKLVEYLLKCCGAAYEQIL